MTRLRRGLSSIWIRLLAFNLLLVFLPLAATFSVDIYERQLLRAQEREMVQQGRILAAALATLNEGSLSPESAVEVLNRLEQRTTARLRVVDLAGKVVADSVRSGGSSSLTEEEKLDLGPRDSWSYRLGAGLWKTYGDVRGFFLGESAIQYSEATGEDRLPGVEKALDGHYGAAFRTNTLERSSQLYSALPIHGSEGVIGAVVVSQSTIRLLQDLYRVRLRIFKIFLVSVLVSVVISLLVATTIVAPLRRLRTQATEVVGPSGQLKGRFRGTNRLDEIGALSRSLEDLSHRLADRLDFIETFAADVSHEFRNPLASIRTATEMLAQAESEKEREEFLRMAESEVARLERLLAAVKEMTALDSTPEESDTLEMPHLVETYLQGRKRLLGAQFRVDFRSLLKAPVFLRMPVDGFIQVLDNLLDNASSFSPDENPIHLEIREDDGFLILRLRDEGPGILPEHLTKVFHRFFSYRDPGKDQSHVGLGLAIVARLVEKHGGTIRALNHPEGGAIFEMKLPCGSIKQAPAAPGTK